MLDSYFDLQTVVYLLCHCESVDPGYVTLVSKVEDPLNTSWSSENASCQLKRRMCE